MAQRKNTVVDKDMGWKATLRAIRETNGQAVKVGILGNAAPADDGTDMILIAAANEFGTGDGRIPPRPFIRGAFEANIESINNFKAKLWGKILDGTMTPVNALSLLGRFHQGQVQRYMTELRQPPNADSTIERKGSDNPLIDTGRLRNSVTWTLEK